MSSTINPDQAKTGAFSRQAQTVLSAVIQAFYPPYTGWVYLLGVMLIVAVGVSGKLIDEWYAPLMIGGAVVGVAMAFVWLRDPLWALLPAIIMIFLPQGMIPPEIQSLGNRVLTLATLGCWGAQLVFRHKLIRWTMPTMLFTVFITWSLLSLTWAISIDDGISIIQIYVLRMILFLILIPNLINNQDALKKFLTTIALSGWILIFASYYVVLTEGWTPGSRLQVYAMNANGLGVQAIISAVGALWWAMLPGRYRSLRMTLGVLYIILTIGVVAMSGSRGSAISLGIMLVLFWIQKPTRFWGNLALILVLLALPTLPVVFDTLIQRFQVTGDDTALGGREVIWESAIRAIGEEPVLGAGIGNASRAARPYLQLLKGLTVSEGFSLHNPLLTIWVETGLPGLLMYLGVLLSAVWFFIQGYWMEKVKDPNMRNYFALVLAIFVGYLASWIKGGGMEKEFTYFFMLSLLILPTVLQPTQEQVSHEKPAEVA